MKRLFLIAAFILLLSSYDTVFACSCAGYASPCEAYAAADAVFVGYVKKVKPDNSMKGDDAYEGEQTAYVQVERAFKGVYGLEIVLHQPGHNCAPKFKAGDRWLLYATYHKESKTWEVYGCGRSRSIESANDDLLYLQRLPESAATTRISGELNHYEEDPQKGFSLVKTIAGVKVKITGAEKTYEVYTNSNGVYEIYGLLPGKYSIEPEIPSGLKIRFPMSFGEISSEGTSLTVELQANSCAGSDFILSSDTSVKGKILGADGEILPRVCVNIVPADKVANRYFNEFDCTEEDGRFAISEIPPGKYILVVNDDGKISGDEPFRTVYYPGVFEKEKATVIIIDEGSRLENYDVHIPSQLPTKIVRGVLLYSDGQPVAREIISFKAKGKDARYERDASALTDGQGHFSLKILKGTIGWLNGEMYVYESKYEDCPQVDKIVKKNGDKMVTVMTNRIGVEVKDDIQDVKLTFPFPFCHKSKDDN